MAVINTYKTQPPYDCTSCKQELKMPIGNPLLRKYQPLEKGDISSDIDVCNCCLTLIKTIVVYITMNHINIKGLKAINI